MGINENEVKLSELFDKLLDEVTDNIINNVVYEKDRTGTDELLSFIPVDNLIGFLSEEEWEKYKSLLRGRKMYHNSKTFH